MSDKTIKTSIVEFDNLNFEEAVARIVAASQKSSFSYVVTPNIDHLARLVGTSEKSLHSPYEDALLRLCDSRILDKMLRFRRKYIEDVIPGSSLTQHLFQKVLGPKDRVVIVGVEDRYISKLRELNPELDIIHINASMGFIDKPDEVESILSELSTIQPNYTFLCVGSPRQEVLAQKIKQSAQASGVGLCVGASVLFLVGAEKRAPRLLQKLHLEWAYRITQDPKRLLKRYGWNFYYLPRIFSKL